MEDKKQVETMAAVEGHKQPTIGLGAETTFAAYETTPLLTNGDSSNSKADEQADGDDQDNDEANQNATNLITVAVAKVATFASLSFLVETGIIETVLGVFFLAKLIGLWATFGGLFLVLLVQPLSTWITNNYSHAEDQVMDAREKKSEVVSEMLHGVKMIKISSTESHWKQKIVDARSKELKSIFRLSAFGLALEVTWLSMPVLFSTTSLGIYAYLNGGINAATAFTALSVFSGYVLASSFEISPNPYTVWSKLLEVCQSL
jgi:ABC-type multidrug transport system fused ATPase/permease subunit